MRSKFVLIAAIATALLLSGCAQPPAGNGNKPVVAAGDTVSVEYEGKLQDGTQFDSSEKAGKPLEFAAGAGQMIQGFDAAVIGMA
ncbi:MAG: FKBP-type peptidyl-prolyl cis-trans isomerase, partial [Candidatus Diapherotrites archaeon]|nr:FKBP-type peptidyl-prolyl cis-trans isomerase [Candidatus Diapherotrites archaeon]